MHDREWMAVDRRCEILFGEFDHARGGRRDRDTRERDDPLRRRGRALRDARGLVGFLLLFLHGVTRAI